MQHTIGVLGGTGPVGRGLAQRLAARGHEILIGSRSPARAATVARIVQHARPGSRVTGTSNARAAGAPIVFVTVPFGALDDLLTPLREPLHRKLIVEVVNPLRVRHGAVDVIAIPEGSAAEHIRVRLPGARIVSALKTNSARHLAAADSPLPGDALLCGDDAAANDTIRQIIEDAGARVVVVGPLALSRLLEHTAALVLSINRRYRAETSICITGLPGSPARERDG